MADAPKMTKDQQAVFDAASLLAKTENDANEALLDKLTGFLSDIQSIADGMSFPPGYASTVKQVIAEISMNLAYRRDIDLPNKIQAYNNANAPSPTAGLAAQQAPTP